MLSLETHPSTATILSLYTSFTATAMLFRGVVTELQAIVGQILPPQLQAILLSKLTFWPWWKPPSNIMTLHIHQHGGGADYNELYEASEVYLSTKVTTASLNTLKVSKSPRDKALELNIDSDDNVDDVFEEMQLHWRMTCIEAKEQRQEKKVIELSFDKKHLDKVVGSFLPYVLERSKAIQEENKAVKLYSMGGCFHDYDDGGEWTFTNLDHPSTFDTLAIDPKLKKELIDDLDRFVRRRDFYKRVGKAWKRGYLLYGPPGTGKSSLIAAMANYLKFSIYDLELTSVYDNSSLRRLLGATKNRSIVVIEDIDCSAELKDREASDYYNNRRDSNLTLSGLLNFIDGLYSSCGDERIIVFTTNHKDKLDPALLRPGRMDMHIHMSYCSPSGFRILASNYLGIASHDLFAEIDKLMVEVEVTPAQVAEELMKSEDVDIALGGLLKFLEGKKSEPHINDCGKGNEEEEEEEECETDSGSERQGRKSSVIDKKAVKRKNRRRLKIVHR